MNAEHQSPRDWFEAHQAAGRLPAPMRLFLDAHAEINPAARTRSERADELAAALLANETPAEMREDALQRAFDAIGALDDIERQTGDDAIDMSEIGGLPQSVRDAVRDAPRARWSFAAPGISSMELARDGDAKAELLRIRPGAGAPMHSHTDVELTLVLHGAFRAGGALYRPGEVCVAGPDVTHRPVAEPGETCFALAVTKGGLKFTGLLGALQKLFERN